MFKGKADPHTKNQGSEHLMHNVFYIVGVIVVVLIILSLLGIT